jgi:hypothetical protein
VIGNGKKDPVTYVTTAVRAVIAAVSATSRGFGVRLSVIHQRLADSSRLLLKASILFKPNPVRLPGLDRFAGLRTLP